MPDTDPTTALMTLTLRLTPADYIDVVRVLSIREQAIVTESLPEQTNGALFASVCREWEHHQTVASHAGRAQLPQCQKCGLEMTRSDPNYVCVGCGNKVPLASFVPIQMMVQPAVFAFVQSLRQRIGAKDVADMTNVAWSVYGGLVEIDAKGGEVRVRPKGGSAYKLVNLYPHRAANDKTKG